MYIPPGYSQVNYFFTGAGLPRGAQVTFSVKNVNADNPSVVAEAMGGQYNAWIRPHATNQTTMSGILVKNGPNETGPSSFTAYGSVGLKVAGDVYPNVALLVRKNTLSGGRQGRGRFFWPVLGESNIGNGGYLDPNLVQEFQDAFESFLFGLADGGHQMHLLHAKPDDAPHSVVSLDVQNQIATQRRRLRK